jgi:hypothetical protein
LAVPGVSLSYEGQGPGKHEKTVDCDRDARLQGSGRLEVGQVLVEVFDGKEDRIYDATFEGQFAFNETPLYGAAGTWTIRVDREGDDPLLGDEFDGRYEFALMCVVRVS